MAGINPEETDDESFRAALAFFVAVEHSPMDDEHNDLADALVDEFGPDEILRGLALVAAVLRVQLRDHAKRFGCSCGDDEWLKRVVWAQAEREDAPEAEFPITTCITCGVLIPHGASRCPKHRGKAWANRPTANQDRYSGDWPAIRARVLQRDRYRCQVQGPGCDGHGVEADHIVSVADGGNNDLINLRAICVPCHRRRTGQQGARAAKARRREAKVIPLKPRTKS